MPKRNSRTSDHGGSAPPRSNPRNPPPDRLQILITLINLDTAVVPGLRAGARVILTGKGRTYAETPLGSRIGDVADHDAERLLGKVILSASIYQLGLDPPQVVLEVVLG